MGLEKPSGWSAAVSYFVAQMRSRPGVEQKRKTPVERRVFEERFLYRVKPRAKLSKATPEEGFRGTGADEQKALQVFFFPLLMRGHLCWADRAARLRRSGVRRPGRAGVGPGREPRPEARRRSTRQSPAWEEGPKTGGGSESGGFPKNSVDLGPEGQNTQACHRPLGANSVSFSLVVCAEVWAI